MLLWTSVLFFSCVSASQAPEVTIDAQLLKLFGVTDNVNKKGHFQELMAAISTVNSGRQEWRAIASEAKRKTLNLITEHAQFSAKNLSRGFIEIYHQIPEKHVAQFITAHLLNLWTRLVATISVFNESVLWSLKKLEHGKIHWSCRTGQVVQMAAVQLTKELNIGRACVNLETTLNQDSYRGQLLKADLRDLIRSVEKSEDGITVVNALIFDETVPLSGLHKTGITQVVPHQFEHLFIPALLESFKDYDSFLDSLSAEENEKLSNVLGLPVTVVKTSLIEAYKAFVVDRH